MLKDILYTVVNWMAMVHDKISHLNDKFEASLSDKMLHFLVIGVLGVLLICMIHPLFRWLARNHHVMAITGIYVFTLILVFTFAIEIGQRVTGTGKMEFADIVFGIGGFICFFVVFLIVRAIIDKIKRDRYIRKYSKPNHP